MLSTILMVPLCRSCSMHSHELIPICIGHFICRWPRHQLELHSGYLSRSTQRSSRQATAVFRHSYRIYRIHCFLVAWPMIITTSVTIHVGRVSTEEVNQRLRARIRIPFYEYQNEFLGKRCVRQIGSREVDAPHAHSR